MSNQERVSRRSALKATGGLLVGATLAGCSSGGGNGNGNGGDGATVEAVNFEFDPEEVTISTGETVTWSFESAGHNVCAWPEMFDEVSIPDGADGFGTMPQDGNRYATVDQGETFEHTFETAGEYTYVCGPHVGQGMIGTVVVE